MSTIFTHNRVLELETLILDTLLPIYEKYYRDKGVYQPPNKLLNELTESIKSRHKLPALLMPKKDINE